MGLMSLEETLKGQLKNYQNGHIMLIDGMYKLTTHKVEECQSSVFHLAGLKWKLTVLPAGKESNKDYVSFFLRIKDKKSLPPAWEVKCSLKFSLFAQTGSNNYSRCDNDVRYNAKSISIGYPTFIPHAVLQGITSRYLLNDRAVFCVEVTNVKPNFIVTVVPRAMGTAERLKLDDVPRNKSRFTWKISRFSTFNSESHSSYEFTVGSRRWKLLMYPKGVLTGKGNSLSLFLHATDYVTYGPKAKTLAVYKLRVLDQLNHNHYETTHSGWFRYSPDSLTRAAWGSANYLPLEILNNPSRGLLVKDEICIGVEFLLLSTTDYL